MTMTTDMIRNIAVHVDVAVDRGTDLLAIQVPKRSNARERARAQMTGLMHESRAAWSQARELLDVGGFGKDRTQFDFAYKLLDINPTRARGRAALGDALESAKLLREAIDRLPDARVGIERMGPNAWIDSARPLYAERTPVADVVEFMAAEGRLRYVDDTRQAALDWERMRRQSADSLRILGHD